MKKIVYLLLCLVCVFSFTMLGACTPDESTTESGLKIRNIGGVYTVIGYTAEEGVTSLTISTTDDGKEIGAIKKNAFKNNTTLTEIVVGSSVKEIGEGAFAKMSNLKKITLPFVGAKQDAVNEARLFGYVFSAGEEYDGGYAVSQNYNASSNVTYYLPQTLTDVVINPQEDYEVPMYSFYGLTRIKNVTIGDNVSAIGDYAYYGCTGLRKVVLGSGVLNIGEQAFVMCTNLKGDMGTGDVAFELSAQAKLKTIEAKAFMGTKLENIVLPDTVENIGEYAFASEVANNEVTTYGASLVKTVALSENLKVLDNGAFFRCSSLTEVSMSAGVEKIGIAAFEGCSKLNAFTVAGTAANDTKIYSSAFKNCTSLKNVDLSAFTKLSLIDDDAFNGCTLLESVSYVNTALLGDRVFAGTSMDK